MTLKPDEHYCKRCGEPVRYANVHTGRGYYTGMALDTKKVRSGPYDLVEQEVADENGNMVPSGRWIAVYVRVAERKARWRYRQHSCDPEKVAALKAKGLGS